MEYKEIINRIKPEMDKVFVFLDKELAKVRTGRVSPSLVEDIIVDLFGERLPLKQLGVINTPGPREIAIQPWDKSYIEPIQSALSKTGIGANPVVDKDIIRIYLPLLSEEYRKELIKVIADKQEECRRTLRKLREDAWREIQDRTKEGEIREDDKFRAKDELQDLIDEYGEKIEKIGEKKSKEVMDG
ncbi:MAG: ribosome recycling factor [Candidatus Parcubacteria bacterium]|nr:ribosome recycling factor [Candidatus Parcubacteria bacterium]